MKLPLSPLTIDAVQAESLRAHLKHGVHSMLNPNTPVLEKLAALVEECGEVGRALTYDEGDSVHLVKELIQVACIALSWVEALEGENPLGRDFE